MLTQPTVIMAALFEFSQTVGNTVERQKLALEREEETYRKMLLDSGEISLQHITTITEKIW